ncbi:Tripartite tricarboxylate transporter family receptor [Pigmentiphaga humi]|uniref:Tripartite tricarboxylate transporter family receptor n=1 Tax=Pigmentiphaga humi TaxID=2478468 RepID=A0A3P4B4P7_9BURK|nr:tripartite tricarboxylate transporter substrate binding protein [Pigmentiphaga humi]VCU71267.1 Tripartite tricarboxylate transporter family receptor [Pigmentiphaga humi]
MERFAIWILALLFTLAGGMPAHAASYPDKPVRIVVPYPPGGTVDQLARLLAQQLAGQTGQSFIVDNRAGASGVIGSEHVAQSPPDGYTLLLQATTFVINPLITPASPYDVRKDFTPVSFLGSTPMLVVAHPSLPAQNFAGFVELLRKQPGRYSLGAPAVGALGHLAEEAVKRDARLDFLVVPYKGTAPMLNDVAGNHVAAGIEAMPALLPMVRGGKLKALAVTGERRVPQLPGIPTVAESGLPGFDMVSWYGLWAPAGLAPAVLQELSAQIAKATRAPQLVGQMAEQGLQVQSSTPAELGARIDAETAKYQTIVKAANIKVE